jgi:hypothetical protein
MIILTKSPRFEVKMLVEYIRRGISVYDIGLPLILVEVS